MSMNTCCLCNEPVDTDYGGYFTYKGVTKCYCKDCEHKAPEDDDPWQGMNPAFKDKE